MLLRHTIWYLLTRVGTGALSITVIALFSRMLEPGEYGLYAVVVSVSGVVVLLVFGWLRLALARELPGTDRKTAMASVLPAYAALVVLTGSVGLLLGVWVLPERWGWLAFFGVLFLWSQSWFDLMREHARANLRPVVYAALSLARGTLLLLAGWVLISNRPNAEAAVAALVVATVLPGILASVLNGPSLFRARPDSATLRRMSRYGVPLAAAMVLWAIIGSSDRLLILWLMDSDAAGLYSVGYDLTEHTIGVLMLTVSLAGFPLAVGKLEREGEAVAKAALREQATIILAIGIPATAGFAVLTADIVDQFLGRSYREFAAAIMPWIAGGAFLGGLKLHYFDISFHLSRDIGRLLRTNLYPAMLNVFLNIWWIPLYGILGAAFATVVSYGFALGAAWVLGREAFPLPMPIREVRIVAVATGVMVVSLIPLASWSGPGALGSKIALGMLVYVLALSVMNYRLTRSLLQNMRSWPGFTPIDDD